MADKPCLCFSLRLCLNGLPLDSFRVREHVLSPVLWKEPLLSVDEGRLFCGRLLLVTCCFVAMFVVGALISLSLSLSLSPSLSLSHHVL